MMKLNQTSFYVKDVLAVNAFLETILAVKADVVDETFAQLTIGDFTFMLFKSDSQQTNVLTLHFQVDSVDDEYERLSALSLSFLERPHQTEWGTYSMLFQGPENLVIDFYAI